MKRLLLAAALSLAAGAAQAQIAQVRAICESTSATAANTVELRFSAPMGHGKFWFAAQPAGMTHAFPNTAWTPSLIRKFSLPPGVYRLTFQVSANTPMVVYAQDVRVSPYQVNNGVCAYTGAGRQTR